MPYTEETLRQLVWQRRIFLAINVVSALAFGILWYFIHNQGNTIQNERAAAIRRNCIDQNMRHDNTIKVLNREISQLPPDRRARAEASKQFTIFLINALDPKLNCNKVVQLSVPSK